MKIRTSFIIFGIYILAFIFMLIYLQIRIAISVKEYSRIYQHTIKSQAIARQYQQNSAFLTQFVRSYVATGDSKYEQAYNDCIAISGGQKATPIDYDRGLYWSIYLGSGNKPSGDGEAKSYSNVMKDLNFSKEMFDFLTLSKKRSEDLVKLEIEAMELIKNIPKTPDGKIPDEYKTVQLEAIELVNGKSYEEKVSEIISPINQFFDVLYQSNNLNLQKATSKVKKYNILFFICLFIVGFSVVILLTYLARRLGRNLSLCMRLASEISNGNLGVKIDESKIKGNNEFSLLLNNFHNMIEKLKDIISRVLESSKSISEAATEIAQGNADLSHRTEMQASHLEETASSIEQIASTIKSSADNSVIGNKMMQDSEKSVQEAGSIIEATTNNIELVYEASNKITDIIKIIENIAFQTNILALNAAVEAARAGEQGKGFAVVASEVRSLAQSSQDSAKDITELVNQVYEKISKANEIVESQEQLFMGIKEQIEETANIIKDISSAALEQQSGVAQVNKAVTEMDNITQENAALVEESTASSISLYNNAKELQNIVSFFSIEQ